jgi:hypothetical protein
MLTYRQHTGELQLIGTVSVTATLMRKTEHLSRSFADDSAHDAAVAVADTDASEKC